MYKIDNLQSQTLQNLASRTALGIYTKTHATFENTRLARFALQSQAAKLLPKERVKSCLRCRIDASISVGVKYNTKREKAHYSNLQRCGSVWHCPVCASIITEKRRAEIKKLSMPMMAVYTCLPLPYPIIWGITLNRCYWAFVGL